MAWQIEFDSDAVKHFHKLGNYWEYCELLAQHLRSTGKTHLGTRTAEDDSKCRLQKIGIGLSIDSLLRFAAPLIGALVQCRKACSLINSAAPRLGLLGDGNPLQNATLGRPGKGLEIGRSPWVAYQRLCEVVGDLQVFDGVELCPRTVSLGGINLCQRRWTELPCRKQAFNAHLVRTRPAGADLARRKPKQAAFLVKLVWLAVDPAEVQGLFNRFVATKTRLAGGLFVRNQPDTLLAGVVRLQLCAPVSPCQRVGGVVRRLHSHRLNTVKR